MDRSSRPGALEISVVRMSLSRRGEKILRRDQMALALGKECCQRKCLDSLNVQQLELCRKSWIGLRSKKAQKTWLMTYLAACLLVVGGKTKLEYQLPTSPPLPVCRKGFLVVYGEGQGGFSSNMLDDVRHELGLEGDHQVRPACCSVVDTEPEGMRAAPMEAMCITALQQYVNKSCDRYPPTHTHTHTAHTRTHTLPLLSQGRGRRRWFVPHDPVQTVGGVL